MAQRIPPKFLLNPIHFLSLGFGTGLTPVAPGTAGTLAAIPIYWLFLHLTSMQYLFATLLLFVVGIKFCSYTSTKLGVHDHPAIVWDEVVGYLLTMVAVPMGWMWMLLGFIVFRLFDIWKPWPIRALDRSVKGGFGIMLDDVIAAVYASITLQSLLYIWKGLR